MHKATYELCSGTIKEVILENAYVTQLPADHHSPWAASYIYSISVVNDIMIVITLSLSSSNTEMWC